MASIRKKGENTYEITVSNGYDSTGKKLREYKVVTLPVGLTEKQTQKELTRISTLFEEEVRSGDYINPNLYKLSDFCNEYLKFKKGTENSKGALAPRTWDSYKKIIDQRIIPVLGHYKLNEIKPLHIQRFISSLEEPGQRNDDKGKYLSSAYIRKIHAVTQSVFARAYKLGLISKNPATTDSIDLPKLEQDEVQIFNEDQSVIMLESLENEPLKYQVLVHLALTIGSRRGELMALTWNDIDLDSGVISIKHSAYKLKDEEQKLKDPKNKNSIRDVSIPEYVIELLKTYRKEQLADKMKVGDLWLKDERDAKEKLNEKWIDPGWLFTQWNGKPMNVDFPSRWFPKFIKKHNKAVSEDKTLTEEQKDKLYLPKMKFHALRHTSATLLLYAGHNVKAVGSRLGHSQLSTTNRYLHAMKKADKAAAETMQSVFGKTPKNKNTIVGQ